MSSETSAWHNADPNLPLTEGAPSEFEYDAFATELAHQHGKEDNGRMLSGAIWLSGAVASSAAIVYGSQSNGKLALELPYSPAAQAAVEAVDSVMAYAGSVALPAAVGAVAFAKIGSRWNPRLRAADLASSQELTDDGKGRPGKFRKGLRKYAAGSVPIVSSVAVAAAAVMSGIGEEITEGPSRPIETFFDAIPSDKGLSLILQDGAASPMLESNISRQLTQNIQAEAASRGVLATPLDIYLPSIHYKNQDLASLAIAVQQPENSPVRFEATSDCQNVPVPVAVDHAARIPIGSHIEISGVEAVIVAESQGMSAINRIGVEVDPSVFASCFSQNPEAPHDMVALSTDQETAQDILAVANAELNKPATVISKDSYIENSEDFWTHNSRPLTNMMALMSGGLAFLSMGGIVGARILRNRREWATKLAQGVSDNQLRATEILRALKDGTMASAIGVVAATGVSALTNTLESGLQVGMSYHSAMVGSAVGILGSVGGALHNVLRPRRTVDPAEHTRI